MAYHPCLAAARYGSLSSIRVLAKNTASVARARWSVNRRRVEDRRNDAMPTSDFTFGGASGQSPRRNTSDVAKLIGLPVAGFLISRQISVPGMPYPIIASTFARLAPPSG